jgi:hypothetical protein
MNERGSHALLLVYVIFIAGILGCQQETPAEKAQSPQPDSAVDRASQQAVDAINTPIDKARGVEDTLRESAERTADKVKETAQ